MKFRFLLKICIFLIILGFPEPLIPLKVLSFHCTVLNVPTSVRNRVLRRRRNWVLNFNYGSPDGFIQSLPPQRSVCPSLNVTFLILYVSFFDRRTMNTFDEFCMCYTNMLTINVRNQRTCNRI